MDQLLYVSLAFQYFDVIWRCLQTIRIIRRFWGRSALAVDAIDMTTDAEAKSRTAKVFSPLQARHLPHRGSVQGMPSCRRCSAGSLTHLSDRALA